MKTSSDKYYDDYNLMYIMVISTYKSSEKVLKVHGLDLNNLNDEKNYINQLKLVKGRLPNKSGECV